MARKNKVLDKLCPKCEGSGVGIRTLGIKCAECEGTGRVPLTRPKAKRQRLISQLEWNSGGYGFGICSFAASMIWSDDRPNAREGKRDLRCTIAVCGDPKKYTTAELETLVAFAKKATARYDELYKWRRGCNLILFEKDEFDGKPTGRWMRKRLTWQSGPMYSSSLEEAIAVFEKEWHINDNVSKQPQASV